MILRTLHRVETNLRLVCNPSKFTTFLAPNQCPIAQGNIEGMNGIYMEIKCMRL